MFFCQVWHHMSSMETCIVLLLFFMFEYMEATGFHCIGNGRNIFPLWNSWMVMRINNVRGTSHSRVVSGKWVKFPFWVDLLSIHAHKHTHTHAQAKLVLRCHGSCLSCLRSGCWHGVLGQGAGWVWVYVFILFTLCSTNRDGGGLWLC